MFDHVNKDNVYFNNIINNAYKLFCNDLRNLVQKCLESVLEQY